MGPLDKYILADDALRATEQGFELHFQSHWYRSLPLSCMDFSLAINGEQVDTETLTVDVNGKTFSYADLADADTEYLFILDKAVVKGKSAERLQAGKSYPITFNLDLHIPYILIGPQQKPLLAGSQVDK